MDDTFKYYNKYFTQMFTIHAFNNGHYTPLVFFLLPNKNFETYFCTFNKLVRKCSEIGLSLALKSVTRL